MVARKQMVSYNFSSMFLLLRARILRDEVELVWPVRRIRQIELMLSVDFPKS